MSDTTYQGWRNYETWCVKLWIDNDEGSYRYWQEQARDAYDDATDAPTLYASQSVSDRARSRLANQLKTELDDDANELGAKLPESGMYADLLNAALSEVDWYEIADALLVTAAESDDAIAYDAHK